MRPQITFPKSLSRALNYHEKKVDKGTAELLHAHGFYKLPEEMNFHDKKERFEELMVLNERSENKLMHISLNWHPSEAERLTDEFYIHLADQYMEKIGFGDQPYLVYKHEDAGHPHIHVLTSLIRNDGTRIKTHNIGKDVSEPARKEMEKEHGFIPADKKEQQQENDQTLKVNPQKIKAGKPATMRSIANVLDHVVDKYKYSSLEELNAILKGYNVKAERGDPNGRIYKNKGLSYVVVDANGKAVTKPVKASDFHSKPTLKKLEEKFKQNEQKKQPLKKQTINAIEWVLRSKPKTLGELAKLLEKEKITMVARQNAKGDLYGITFVDHGRNVVFNGSDMGKQYAAKQILERLYAFANEALRGQQTEKQKEQARTKNHNQKPEPKNEPNPQKEEQIPLSKPKGEKEPLPTNNEPKVRAVESEISKEHSAQKEKLILKIIGPDYGGSSINQELTHEEQKRRKKKQQREFGS